MRLQNLLVALFVITHSIYAHSIDLNNANSDVSQHRTKRISGPLRDPDKLALADYVVSLRSRKASFYFGDNHYCMGTIISDLYVITSAHCSVDKRKVKHRPRSILVVAGAPDRLEYDPEKSWQIPVNKIWVPENFTLRNHNDISILRTSDSMPTGTAGIDMVDLPTEPLKYGQKCIVVGWGRILRSGPLASMITHIDAEIMTREDCESLLPILNDEMFCAGVLSDNIDQNPCAGDGGAPLLCDDKTLVGIVSYRTGCGTTTKPTIYTDVYYHLDWIESVMNNGECSHTTVLLLFLMVISIPL